jgi:hypothetical protein
VRTTHGFMLSRPGGFVPVRAKGLRQTIKPSGRSLDTRERLEDPATMRHSEGMIARTRHSSEAAAKMQGSAIKPDTVHPTQRPSFNEPPSNTGFNTTTWIENRRLKHT